MFQAGLAMRGKVQRQKQLSWSGEEEQDCGTRRK